MVVTVVTVLLFTVTDGPPISKDATAVLLISVPGGVNACADDTYI